MTNRIYVANWYDNTVSVIAGAGPTVLRFVPVTPCRLLDTRTQGGPIQGMMSETFNLPQLAKQSHGCPDLSSAAAYSLNEGKTVIRAGAAEVYGHVAAEEGKSIFGHRCLSPGKLRPRRGLGARAPSKGR